MKAETRRRVLTALHQGWFTVDEIAERLGLSASAVRVHMREIAKGAVIFSRRRKGRNYARAFRMCPQVFAVKAVVERKVAAA